MDQADNKELYQFERPPLVVVFSGTSGSGKDSVVRALVKRMSDIGSPVHFVVTATSRPKRPDEVHGEDYIFVSQAEFEHMLEQDELFEHAIVYGHYRGVPKRQVYEAIASGQDVVMRLDVQGAATIRRLIPEAVLVFLTAPSERELAARLQRRHTESLEQLEIRLETARKEMKLIPGFDYVIVNADQKLDYAVDIAMSILIAERHRVRPRHMAP